MYVTSPTSVLVNAERYLEKYLHTPDLFQIQGCANKVSAIIVSIFEYPGLVMFMNV